MPSSSRCASYALHRGALLLTSVIHIAYMWTVVWQLEESLKQGQVGAQDIVLFEQSLGIRLEQLVQALDSPALQRKMAEQQGDIDFVKYASLFRRLAELKKRQ
eukprot:gene37333-45327_t